jgi:hypothetical protein
VAVPRNQAALSAESSLEKSPVSTPLATATMIAISGNKSASPSDQVDGSASLDPILKRRWMSSLLLLPRLCERGPSLQFGVLATFLQVFF